MAGGLRRPKDITVTGEGRRRRGVRDLLAWAGLTALIITVVYAVAGAQLAASFSTVPAVIAAARSYVGWAVAMPAVGVASAARAGAAELRAHDRRRRRTSRGRSLSHASVKRQSYQARPARSIRAKAPAGPQLPAA